MDNIAKLAQLLATPPKAIELIPGDGQEWLESLPGNPNAPFISLEGNLGVPEKALFKTYMVAIRELGQPRLHLRRLFGDDTQVLSEKCTRALNLTSVILLANPAHQSALNIRKTAIFKLHNAEEDIRNACDAELGFIAALLSVKQCAKVSVLWHHRRTLLSRIHSFEDLDAGTDTGKTIFTDDHFISRVSLPISSLQAEIALASRACQTYPRNYFAWYHRWLCFQSCLYASRSLSHSSGNSTQSESTCVSSATEDIEKVLASEIMDTKLWIERHVSDYSAVEYVCRVGEALDTHLPRVLSSENPAGSEISVVRYASELAQHALELVQTYPSHEALWLYLRRTVQLLSPHSYSNQNQPFSTSTSTSTPHPPPSYNTIRDESMEQNAISLARRLLVDATHRCQTLDPSGSDRSKEQDTEELPPPNEALKREVHMIMRNAIRFLLWRDHLNQNKARLDGQDDSDRIEFLIPSTCAHFSEACSNAGVSLRTPNSDSVNPSPGTTPTPRDVDVLVLRATSSVE